MNWFVSLDASSQQNFIESMISEKFKGTEKKSDESIGLLSFKDGDTSYLVEKSDQKTLQALRITCANRKVKYISSPSDILFDLSYSQEDALEEITQIVTNSDCEMKEISHIPDALKGEFYRALASSGQMSSGGYNKRGGGGNRRGQYEGRNDRGGDRGGY